MYWEPWNYTSTPSSYSYVLGTLELHRTPSSYSYVLGTLELHRTPSSYSYVLGTLELHRTPSSYSYVLGTLEPAPLVDIVVVMYCRPLACVFVCGNIWQDPQHRDLIECYCCVLFLAQVLNLGQTVEMSSWL